MATSEPTNNGLSNTNEAVEKTAQASSEAIEATASASLEMVERMIGFAPWLEPWYAKVSIVLGLGLILYLLKNLLFAGLAKLSQGTGNSFDDNVIRAARKPFSIIILILCLEVTRLILQQQFGFEWLSKISLLSGALLIFTVALFIAEIITNVETEMVARKERKGIHGISGVKAVCKLLRLTVYILAVLIILQLFGVSLTGLLAFGGVGGMVVGLAAKDLLANFFGAMMVYMDRPFRMGDWIRSPDRDIEGTVEDIGWRVTRIRTFDKRPLYVPNSAFTTISIENPSRMNNRRIRESVGIRYDDMACVSTIVEQINTMIKNHPEVDTNNTMIVNLNAFSASSVDILIYAFTKTTDWVKYHGIKQDILLKVEKIISQNGAEIAFPTTTMHIKGDAIPSPDSPLGKAA